MKADLVALEQMPLDLKFVGCRLLLFRSWGENSTSPLVAEHDPFWLVNFYFYLYIIICLGADMLTDI